MTVCYTDFQLTGFQIVWSIFDESGTASDQITMAAHGQLSDSADDITCRNINLPNEIRGLKFEHYSTGVTRIDIDAQQDFALSFGGTSFKAPNEDEYSFNDSE